MRFTNWDVLLFPEDSKVPIQEFEVKCQALPQSHGHLSLHQILCKKWLTGEADRSVSNRLVALASDNYQNSITQVPALTCFVSSLDEGRPFRVSIHNWDKPKPSDLLQSFNLPPERILFEAKLYIDGQLKAQRYMGDQNIWPEVIDTTASDDLVKALRFPPFHTEILQQSHWDASDSLGRVRIVIAEGVSRSSGFPDVRGFDKLREVIVFSFQHAPKHILEYSGIAWPNARMFTSLTLACDNIDFDAHAHSPRKPGSTTLRRNQQCEKNIIGGPGSHALRDSKWAMQDVRTRPLSEDPFIGPAQGKVSRLQTLNGGKMFKHCVGASAKTHSDMSGVEMENCGTEQPSDQSAGQGPNTLAALEQHSLSPNSSPSFQRGIGSNITDQVKPLSSTNSSLPVVTVSSIRSREDFGQAANRNSNGSRRSTSNRSGRMSWEATPPLGYLWSGANNEDAGLPTLPGARGNRRSTSAGSKRKRSLSPISFSSSISDARVHTKGMSTSPQKAASTPAHTLEDPKVLS